MTAIEGDPHAAPQLSAKVLNTLARTLQFEANNAAKQGDPELETLLRDRSYTFSQGAQLRQPPAPLYEQLYDEAHLLLRGARLAREDGDCHLAGQLVEHSQELYRAAVAEDPVAQAHPGYDNTGKVIR